MKMVRYKQILAAACVFAALKCTVGQRIGCDQKDI